MPLARPGARDLRRRIQAEDSNYLDVTYALLLPVQQRLLRFPTRNLRTEMLTDLVQGWRYMEPRNFRTHIEARLDRKRAHILERRVVAGHMRRLDPAWVDEEPDIGITQIELNIDGNKLHVQSQVLATFSLHAIARRHQRHFNNDDAALLHDMDLAAQVDTSNVPPGGYKVHTDTTGGGWRGRMAQISGDNGVLQRVLSIRTWMSE